jgi:hypothetical protein
LSCSHSKAKAVRSIITRAGQYSTPPTKIIRTYHFKASFLPNMNGSSPETAQKPPLRPFSPHHPPISNSKKHLFFARIIRGQASLASKRNSLISPVNRFLSIPSL